ncbi:hypothetical protein VN97_g4289 [Penicillium thymicola]|uniref:Uncharacterized protein n=1 Tax=Penicillium thymicola TaxID=293382 RepID=A0AAI9TKI9_PENTH|nr:hypothetical protein VN97_g4289 [Penicillium thymicola]
MVHTLNYSSNRVPRRSIVILMPPWIVGFHFDTEMTCTEHCMNNREEKPRSHSTTLVASRNQPNSWADIC